MHGQYLKSLHAYADQLGFLAATFLQNMRKYNLLSADNLFIVGYLLKVTMYVY